jgi:hypothetical protein
MAGATASATFFSPAQGKVARFHTSMPLVGLSVAVPCNCSQLNSERFLEAANVPA